MLRNNINKNQDNFKSQNAEEYDAMFLLEYEAGFEDENDYESLCGMNIHHKARFNDEF